MHQLKALLTLIIGYALGVYTLWLFRRAPEEAGRLVDSMSRTQHNPVNEKTLAIVVPIHEGDKDQALEAISSWPATCYENTLDTVDLVIYKAEALRSGDDDLLSRVPMRASRCFRRVRVIHANLLPEVGQRPLTLC